MKCFDYSEKNKKKCKNKNCRYWIDYSHHNNCTLIIAKKEENMTLESIGKIFGITRMRICQIEKRAIKKIKDVIKKKALCEP